MGWKTIVIGSECVCSISLNKLKITIGDEYQTIPLNDLDTVIFSHNRVIMTIPMLSELISHNINIVICDERNDPIGVFQAFNGHSLAFKQLNNQINWKITRKKKLWKLIIEHKIQSEIDAVKYLEKSDSVIKMLIDYKNSVYNNDQTNREGISARIYFTELFGNGFSRGDSDDVRNYALNYGYKILASYISKCITSRGLLTQLGIHHIGEANAFNLTYDFIEPLRSIVDIWVATNIKDSFTSSEKIELVELLDVRVNIQNKWMIMKDAIESLIDSYIAFLNDESNSILRIDIAKGFKRNDV